MPLPIPHLPPIHWLPAGIFLATYLLIAVESNLGSYLDRTAAAFCGAVAMVLARVLTLDAAYQAIDWNTLIFLLGIMILVAHFLVSGFFDWIAVHVAGLARSRLQLLALLVFTSGILSAFFVNDTICLIFAPIVLTVTERLKLPAKPYVIALATSANVGSAMSVTGNPQNALIGVTAKFSFLGFLGHLAPVALVGLTLDFLLLALIFRRELRHATLAAAAPMAVSVDRRLLAKCVLAASLVVVLWMFNFSFPLVAISVGALILLIGRVKSAFIHERIDWTLLLFFASLFVVIRGFETSGATDYVIQRFEPWFHGGQVSQLFALSGIMLVLSNLVSNVPAVLLFRPLVGSFQHVHFVWLVLAATSTLAGNSTPFSSIANLIVLQQANKKVRITFWEFSRVGLVVTLVTTGAAIGLLALEYLLFPSA
ncbi:MAG TPA: SLC13 family permease [Terriglobia bacterium]|nr:SLC13 family permease [Terriglobia bacterium]